jgi:hypothetical protein
VRGLGNVGAALGGWANPNVGLPTAIKNPMYVTRRCSVLITIDSSDRRSFVFCLF